MGAVFFILRPESICTPLRIVSLDMILTQRYGKNVKTATAIKIIPENARKYTGDTPANSTEYFNKSVPTKTEIIRLRITLSDLYFEDLSPNSPANIIGSIGNTHGVKAVNTPAINETKAKYIMSSDRLQYVDHLMQRTVYNVLRYAVKYT